MWTTDSEAPARAQPCAARAIIWSSLEVQFLYTKFATNRVKPAPQPCNCVVFSVAGLRLFCADLGLPLQNASQNLAQHLQRLFTAALTLEQKTI